MPTEETALKTLEFAAYVVEKADDLGLWDRVKAMFSPKNVLLVLGDTGAGKTQFIKSLSDAMPSPIPITKRSEFESEVKPKKIRISDALFIIEDTHGHDGGRDVPHPSRIEAIERARGNSITGVINIVSYGHAESKFIPEPEFQGGKPSLAFVQDMRAREIERVSEWAQRLGRVNTVKWVMTIVNKADVWFSEWPMVEHHYTHGLYAKHLLDRIDEDLRHVVLPYACEQRRFWNLGYVDPIFDDTVRKTLRAELISTLANSVRQ